MKKSLLLFYFIAVEAVGLAQGHGIKINNSLAKPNIDSSVYEKWPSVQEANVSNDGRYMYYIIKNLPVASFTTVIKECEGEWEMRVSGGWGVRFTSDSKIALFTNSTGDTLNVLKLGKSILSKIPDVSSYDTPEGGSGEWIAFKNRINKDLVLLNLMTNERKSYSNVSSFYFGVNGRVLVFQNDEQIIDTTKQSLNWMDVQSGRVSPIWTGNGMVKFIVNKDENQLVFFLKKGVDSNSIWYYDRKENILDLLVDCNPMRSEKSLKLFELSKFSDNGKYVFFTVRKEAKEANQKVNNSVVNVWSYLDIKLQPQQLQEGNPDSYYLVSVNIQTRQVSRLEFDNEYIEGQNENSDVYLISHASGSGYGGEATWNSAAQRFYYVRSTKDSNKVVLELPGIERAWISPSGKYIIYYDYKIGDYFSVEIETNIFRNITAGIKTNWFDYFREDLSASLRGIATWVNNDRMLLIYDKYDIWLVDPLGIKAPMNLTNGYGKVNNTVFSLGLSEYLGKSISDQDGLILNALDLSNKNNGFFLKRKLVKSDPEKLTMSKHIYQLINVPYIHHTGAYPIKAKNERKYILQRMSAIESPNYFFTSDFKQFIPLSYVYPEKEYNWYTVELHSWKSAEGRLLQGVLYKPGNFNPNKKYPVILHYYDKKSNGLNEYLAPEYLTGSCNINIPTYVSNDYLVFCPDISYVIGDPMKGTCDAVISAGNYLSKLPFIDEKKMGIGGCSFGGIQTNYLVTHTNLFAAAYSAGSMSDFVSAYGNLTLTNVSLHNLFEKGVVRMGGTLWQFPDKYVQNSAIFYADRVSTPLLLIQGGKDEVCSFSQAVEFFTALRRLGKTVWLLEYPEASHAILGKSAEDFSVRMAEFFDHYLKDKPAPVWMTRGVPAKTEGN
jgi:dienelactone hydrolase